MNAAHQSKHRQGSRSKLPSRAVSPAILVAVAGGLATIAATNEPYGSQPDEITPPMAVLVAPVTHLKEYSVAKEFVGVVEARRESLVGFELAGTVASVLVDEGDLVEPGTVIARQDTSLLDADRAVLLATLDQARAEAELAELTWNRVRELVREDVLATQELDEAEHDHRAKASALARAQAAVDALDARLAKAELRAPFPALVAGRLVDEGRVLGAGVPVLHLLENVEPDVRVGVAGDSIHDIRKGDRFDLVIQGRPEPATVRAILPVRGNGTRSVDVLLRLHSELNGIRPGDLATLRIVSTEPERGFWLPMSALAESSRGLWATYVAEPLSEPSAGDIATHRVARRELEIIHPEGDRVFVRGTLSDGELVVAEGASRLVPGLAVRIAPDHAFATGRTEG